MGKRDLEVCYDRVGGCRPDRHGHGGDGSGGGAVLWRRVITAGCMMAGTTTPCPTTEWHIKPLPVKGPATIVQANRTSDSLDRDKNACPARFSSILPPWVSNAPWEATLDRFAACFEDLEDPEPAMPRCTISTLC